MKCLVERHDDQAQRRAGLVLPEGWRTGASFHVTLNFKVNWLIERQLAFPADIGSKPVLPARGSRQRVHAGDNRLCR